MRTTKSTATLPAAAGVPEGLLAVAKDARYLQECQELIRSLLGSIFDHNGNRPSGNNNGEDDEYGVVDSCGWLLSSLLYYLCVVHRRKRSLGMQVCGLEFHRNRRCGEDGAPAAVAAAEMLPPPWKATVGSCATLGLLYLLKRSTTTNRTNHPSRNSDQSSPSLRGHRRREFHEEQRRAMLERARQLQQPPSQQRRASNEGSDFTTTTNNNSASTTPGTRSLLIGHRLKRACHRVAMSLFRLVLSLSTTCIADVGGPHTTTTTSQVQPTTATTAASFTSFAWILRLYAAFYCLDGRFATFWHHLMGLGFVREPPKEGSHTTATTSEVSSGSRLVHAPRTYRLVGWLIAAQVAGSLLHSASSWVIRSWILRRSKRQQQQQSLTTTTTSSVSPSIVFETTESSSAHRRPRVVSHVNARTIPQSTQLRSGLIGANGNSGDSNNICIICQQARKKNSSACPISCGHIFCWNCLLLTITTVRPECPLCRAPCRPQDVVALRDY